MAKVFNSARLVGEFKPMAYSSSVPDGWKLCDGSTIGNASSGASSANAYNYFLFIHLWNNYSNTQLVIQTSGGSPTTRGASADADWTANKRMPLPNLIDKMCVGRGNYTDPTSGSITRTFGDGLSSSLGAQSVTLTAAQSGVPAHSHGIGDSRMDATNVVQGFERFANFYPDGFAFGIDKATDFHPGSSASSSHENMSPYHSLAWVISY